MVLFKKIAILFVRKAINLIFALLALLTTVKTTQTSLRLTASGLQRNCLNILLWTVHNRKFLQVIKE